MSFGRFLGALLLFVLILFAVALGYGTAQGYNTWWFRTTADVTVNGVRAGYVHTAKQGRFAIVTRTDLAHRRSYMVGISDHPYIANCKDWTAPNFYLFPVNHQQHICWSWDGVEETDTEDASNQPHIVRPGHVEFTTNSGKKIVADW